MISNKKLIVFTHGGGRFTNQLISYAHLIGFLLENKHDFDLINLAFWKYADFLANTSKDLLCTFPTQHNRWKYLKNIQKISTLLPTKVSIETHNNTIRLLCAGGFVAPHMQTIIAKDVSGLKYCLGKNINSLDLGDPDDVNLFHQARVTILAGWRIRSWELFKKHQIEIKNALVISSEYQQIAQTFMNALRKKYDFIIGVLIRQGDYRIYSQGKYFFETKQYVNWIKQAKDLFGKSTKVGFLIASDEPQNIDKFQNLGVHFATGIAGGKGHYLESMIEISKCDLVMTPPSTFGLWAAFIGNVPVLPLWENSQQISTKDLLKNHIYDAITHPHLSIAVK